MQPGRFAKTPGLPGPSRGALIGTAGAARSAARYGSSRRSCSAGPAHWSARPADLRRPSSGRFTRTGACRLGCFESPLKPLVSIRIPVMPMIRLSTRPPIKAGNSHGGLGGLLPGAAPTAAVALGRCGTSRHRPGRPAAADGRRAGIRSRTFSLPRSLACFSWTCSSGAGPHPPAAIRRFRRHPGGCRSPAPWQTPCRGTDWLQIFLATGNLNFCLPESPGRGVAAGPGRSLDRRRIEVGNGVFGGRGALGRWRHRGRESPPHGRLPDTAVAGLKPPCQRWPVSRGTARQAARIAARGRALPPVPEPSSQR